MCRGLVACLLGVFADKRPVACLRKNNRLVGEGAELCPPWPLYCCLTRLPDPDESSHAFFADVGSQQDLSEDG